MGRLERNCRVGAACRTVCPRLRTNPPRSAYALCFALLAVLGQVLELPVMEKHLFVRSKDELRSAVDALQYTIGEFHCRLPNAGKNTEIGMFRSFLPVPDPHHISVLNSRARTAFDKM